MRVRLNSYGSTPPAGDAYVCANGRNAIWVDSEAEAINVCRGQKRVMRGYSAFAGGSYVCCDGSVPYENQWCAGGVGAVRSPSGGYMPCANGQMPQNRAAWQAEAKRQADAAALTATPVQPGSQPAQPSADSTWLERQTQAARDAAQSAVDKAKAAAEQKARDAITGGAGGGEAPGADGSVPGYTPEGAAEPSAGLFGLPTVAVVGGGIALAVGALLLLKKKSTSSPVAP
jgi:hypothetical protein